MCLWTGIYAVYRWASDVELLLAHNQLLQLRAAHTHRSNVVISPIRSVPVNLTDVAIMPVSVGSGKCATEMVTKSRLISYDFVVLTKYTEVI